jgi:phosphatidylethanolamine/phosphatidyl-N-methylethanolamine N-methyltransferase
MHLLEECGDFFREFRRHFRTTGAVLPSSRFLARALTTQLRQPRSAARILEVGPGTGSVTRAIARRMGEGDRLDAIEINDHFVEMLRDRLVTDKAFQHCQDQIEVIHGALEDLVGDSVYDFIVSGLPLNNFPVAQVREIFATYVRLLKPGGTLSYFEYPLVRQLKWPLVDRLERRRLFRVGRVMRGYIQEFQIRREQIFINVPPATVRHLQIKPVVTVAH